MDTAKAFRPGTILLWRAVADHPEARRIVEMFPHARVQVVAAQRGIPMPLRARTHPIVAGKRVLMLGATSSFVRRFSGSLGRGVRCASYLKLVPVSNGCPYYCTYCYLAYVYRKHLPFIKMNINYDTMLDEIWKVMAHEVGVMPFNMGEMLDSLALDHITRLTERLVPFFSGLTNSYLMLLTKSANVDGLLRIAPHRQVVVSWSLNARAMIEAYEPGTASLDERIDAARRCQEHGYRIRLRVDPGILYSDWRTGYAELIREALAILRPENITLGMLRLLPGHFDLAREVYGRRGLRLRSIALADRGSDWKRRYSVEKRMEFYRFMIGVIRDCDTRVSIGLCRETTDIWKGLHDLCDPGKCNCLIWT